jgi:hypothetical protein
MQERGEYAETLASGFNSMMNINMNVATQNTSHAIGLAVANYCCVLLAGTQVALPPPISACLHA